MAASRKQPTAQPSGVLLRSDIQALGIICENSSEECFKPSSYDMRIGDAYLDTDGVQTAAKTPLRGCDVVVPPLGSVIVSTHEIVKIPGNVVGKFNLRIRLAVKGLFVQMGTQVEPHYHGRLFATLHNVSADEIRLKWEEERLFTIEFYYTQGNADEPKDPKSYLNVQDFIREMSFAKSPMATLLEKSEQATEKYETAKGLLENAAVELRSNISTETNAAKDDLKNWMQSEVKSSVANEISEQSKGWRKLIFEFGVMGLIVVIIATILPIVFGFAMEWSRSIALTAEERTIGSRISTIETNLEAIRASNTGNGRLDALSSRLDELTTTVSELQRENAAMRLEIEEARQMGYTEGQNPGANSETEQ